MATLKYLSEATKNFSILNGIFLDNLRYWKGGKTKSK
jgi:hypothetical protein